ncbi:MAG: hypothetical protein JO130_08785 [Solirubrobacterales bacterium]|nr:hypothetical protein [Solirubrobacterales bacterium]
MVAPQVKRLGRGARPTAVLGLALVAMALLAGWQLAPAARAHGQSATSGDGSSPPLASGDPRRVGRPAVPFPCRWVPAQLSSSTGQFSPADEASPPDTARIQAALDACAGTGRSVTLAASGNDNSFLSAPLNVHSRETLVVADGATLYASLDPTAYQIPGGNQCGTITADATDGCRPFIAIDGNHAGVMGTRGAKGSLGVIDGRGEMTMLGGSESWWQLAEDAHSGGNQNNPRLIQSSGADDLTISQVELHDSPMYHILITNGYGLTVWGVMVDTPAARARNTDGIDPQDESDVTLYDDMVQDGDDCVAIKSIAGLAPSSNITVRDVHCYGTHGISIGSQTGAGISNILVRDDTLSGTDSLGNVSTDDNGIRIKSDALYGGVTQQVTYHDVCMTGIKHPLYFNPHYASGGNIIPTVRDIVLNGVVAVSSAHGATSDFEGYDADHPLQIDLEHIQLDNPAQTSDYVEAGVYNSNVIPSGPGVSVTPIQGYGSVPRCRFPSFGYPTQNGGWWQGWH